MRNLRLVTTFFNNQQYYEKEFLEWYSKHFKCNEFVFFVGIENFQGKTLEIQEQLCSTYKIYYVFYNWMQGDQTQWHNQKQYLWSFLRQNFCGKPTLICDCDEFIYCKDIDSAIKKNRIDTHFYEHMPTLNNSFSLNSITKWNEQGWYFRQSKNYQGILDHGACKSFFFDKKDFLHCSGGGKCKNTKNTCGIDEYASVCFHASLHSLEHYLDPKNYSLTADWNLNPKSTEHDKLENFKKIILNDRGFRTFNLNLSNLLT